MTTHQDHLLRFCTDQLINSLELKLEFESAVTETKYYQELEKIHKTLIFFDSFLGESGPPI